MQRSCPRRYGVRMDSITALNIVLAVASLIGAGVAIWQAIDARSSRAGAEEAVEAAKKAAEAAVRQADATERAVRLQEAQSQDDPWRVEVPSPRQVAYVNNTNSAIIVDEMVPVVATNHLEIETSNVDGRYEPGDRIMIRTDESRYSSAVTLTWRYAGDNRIRTSTLST